MDIPVDVPVSGSMDGVSRASPLSSSPLSSSPLALSSPSHRWGLLAKIALQDDKDPFSNFDDSVPIQDGLRYRYCGKTDEWTHSPVKVKIETKAFAQGALRYAYRAKVKDTGEFHHLDELVHGVSWTKRDCSYWVAKSYQSDSQRDDYEMDVKIQMIAKHYGDEYSKTNAPKKIDVISCDLLEINDGSLFCLEAYIEGEYVKYNNNSGIISHDLLRNTPHTFSHFSFEHSEGDLLICDIQGVNDLYTDPQIHTRNGTDYSEGNLGRRGMALFFYSHVCNKTCQTLGLNPFTLYGEDDDEEEVVGEAGDFAINKKASVLSTNLAQSNFDLTQQFSNALRSDMSHVALKCRSLVSQPSVRGAGAGAEEMRATHLAEDDHTTPLRQFHFASKDDEYKNLDIPARFPENSDLLAPIHYQAARLHESGRIAELLRNLERKDADPTEDLVIDSQAAFYHYQKAAFSSYVPAMLALARLYSGTARDVLPNAEVQDPEREELFLEKAAELGSTVAMYNAGVLFITRGKWGKGAQYLQDYLRIVESGAYPSSDDGILGYDGDKNETFGYECPEHLHPIQSQLAELYRVGGKGLPKNRELAVELYNNAAESAMAALQGRLATKYYEIANKISSMTEEEEEAERQRELEIEREREREREKELERERELAIEKEKREEAEREALKINFFARKTLFQGEDDEEDDDFFGGMGDAMACGEEGDDDLFGGMGEAIGAGDDDDDDGDLFGGMGEAIGAGDDDGDDDGDLFGGMGEAMGAGDDDGDGDGDGDCDLFGGMGEAMEAGDDDGKDDGDLFGGMGEAMGNLDETQDGGSEDEDDVSVFGAMEEAMGILRESQDPDDGDDIFGGMGEAMGNLDEVQAGGSEDEDEDIFGELGEAMGILRESQGPDDDDDDDDDDVAVGVVGVVGVVVDDGDRDDGDDDDVSVFGAMEEAMGILRESQGADDDDDDDVFGGNY